MGQVESVDAAARAVTVKLDDGASLVAALAEKAALVKVAPGEKSLQNATPIDFSALTPGDRVLIRGGERSTGRIEGALRVVVMAKTDLAARNEEEQRAWRERAVVGTVTGVEPARGQFTIQVSSTATTFVGPASPGSPAASLAIDARNATLHRYSDSSARFDDAKSARLQDMAEGDQIRLLGTRSGDGAAMIAERVVFGSFKTRALSVESVDAARGVLMVKDLETNEKIAISMVSGGSIRKIPAEMGMMLTAMANGERGARRAQAGDDDAPPGGEGRAQRAPRAAAGRPEGAARRGTQLDGGGGARGEGAGSARNGQGLQGMVERMPTITLADLKKDDWVGAVVGKVDASGKAIAFNMLAGIEIFASRPGRSGGVEVGMPAGLLDGGMETP